MRDRLAGENEESPSVQRRISHDLGELPGALSKKLVQEKGKLNVSSLLLMWRDSEVVLEEGSRRFKKKLGINHEWEHPFQNISRIGPDGNRCRAKSVKSLPTRAQQLKTIISFSSPGPLIVTIVTIKRTKVPL